MRALIAFAAVGGFAAAWHALRCWLWPFTTCGMCGGAGRRVTWPLRRFRRCLWCGGRGVRLRLGRRLFNRATALRYRATTRRQS